MRLLALLLLLANAALFAWARYGPHLGSLESHLLSQQINPEAVRLLTPPQAASFDARTMAGAPRPGACVEWGAFNRADVPRAQSALEDVAATARITERRVDESAGWWVYIPPQENRQAANQKVAELKRLGVDDYFVVQEESRFRFAVSLGLFRTEQAANIQLEQLRARGVRTALVGPRPTAVQKIYLQLRDYPEGIQAKFAALKVEFPATELQECPSSEAAG
jgi:hypothetical protein